MRIYVPIDFSTSYYTVTPHPEVNVQRIVYTYSNLQVSIEVRNDYIIVGLRN